MLWLLGRYEAGRHPGHPGDRYHAQRAALLLQGHQLLAARRHAPSWRRQRPHAQRPRRGECANKRASAGASIYL